MSKRPTLDVPSPVPSGHRCRPWPAVRHPGRPAVVIPVVWHTAKKLSLKKTPAPVTSASSSRKRRAARAASAARALREAQEPRFKLDASGALVPDVRAEAAIIYDSATGQVLWESNSNNQRSIASITKVMTAVVFLENSPDLSDIGRRRPVRCPRRLHHVSSRRLHRDEGRPAAPDAHRLGQRRRSRAGARLAVRLGWVHRPDEREGQGSGSRPTRTTRIRRACSPPTCRRRTTWPSSSPLSPATSASPASCASRTTRSRPVAA